MIDVSIIIPVYNEGEVITKVIKELIDYHFSFTYEIIVINDGSTDDSLEKIEKYKSDDNFNIISNIYNKGYGASLKLGIKEAIGKYVATYDGDGQFFPEYIEKFYQEAEENNLDAVVGQRNSLSSGSPIWRALGKFFIRYIINSLIGVKLKDFNCGLRLIKGDVIKKYLHLCSDKFSFSTTSLMVLISRNYNYKFLGIELKERNQGKSQVKIMSGLNTIYLVIKMIMLFNPLKIFFSSGVIFLFLGVVWGLNYLIASRGLSIGALLLILIGFLSVFLGLIADQISEIRKSQFED